ncbi:MAG TPA: adenylate/guanylate cyclase domain-containing protein [Candidatus Limnocylindria bacterium]|nr:adenylate/guanylate cyclase domain-containing protein [Candidatus Limnocylindria bacterium]
MRGVAEQQERDAAIAAFDRHAWREAHEHFAKAERAGELAPADVEAFAEAAWWIGDPDAAITLRERAFRAYLAAGERRHAARVALLLVRTNLIKGNFTIGTAWLARAEELLGDDADSTERGYVHFWKAMVAGESGDPENAATEAQAAYDLGARNGDRDLRALALALRGLALVGSGQAREGMQLVDQATVAAVSGDLSLFVTGWVFCMQISACRDLGDMRKAGEWTEAAKRWCDRESITGFPGVCKIRQAEIMALRGALARAEQEARAACDELRRWGIRSSISEGLYEIGEIRFRMGDLPGAEDAFRQVHEMGSSPEPGLSLIRLAEGKAAPAHAAVRRALAEQRGKPARARLLPAQVEVAIAAGDQTVAQAAVEELAGLATAFGTPAVAAHAIASRGALRLAKGETDAAVSDLRGAVASWQQLDAPYEASRTRMLLAQAFRASGDEDSAVLELESAKATFERIGAARDARLAAAALGREAAPSGTPAERTTRTFLFTDIVGSTDLVRVIGDEAWRDVIRWHDEALRAIIAKHGGEEIRHQGDGFFVSFAAAERALAAAVEVQKRLAEHRRTSGFAPAVRIGVHETEATKRGTDYAGVGVHEAARVAALAEGGEILVTRATFDAGGAAFAAGAPRSVTLKGIDGAVEVLPVAWR